MINRNLIQVLEKLNSKATLTLSENRRSKILIKLLIKIPDNNLETKINLISLVRGSLNFKHPKFT